MVPGRLEGLLLFNMRQALNRGCSASSLSLLRDEIGVKCVGSMRLETFIVI